MVRARTPPDRTWATGPSSRSVTRCPASGSPALMHVIAEADVAGGVHGPLDLDHVTGCRGQRRRPGRAGTGRGEPG